MMLFDTEQYHQPKKYCYKRDWDGTNYDSPWDEPNDIAEIPQDRVSAVVEHSAVAEVLEEEKKEVKNDEISSERWNPAHFGETPRKVDANGNPTIFWDESIEPPEPDDFESLQEYEEAWQKWEENSDNSICAAELGQASLSQESSPGKSNYADCAKSTSFVKKSCSNASPVCQSTTTCENSDLKEEASTSLPHPHLVNHLPSKESAWVEQIHGTVSPPYCNSLTELNPNFSAWKTSPDYCRHPNTQEKNPEHISSRCSGSFAPAGTMQNGLLSERDLNLEPNGLGKDSYSLPRPGALSKSSPSSRPPGNTKSEAKAKKLGLIGKNEVYNPEWLEQEFGLPIGWTDPEESRAATELLELEGQPSETASTTGLPPLYGKEYSTSANSASVREQVGEYSITPNIKAISLWQPWASLISLGLKHYETRSWKTKYKGKLLICSTAANSKQHEEYLKICEQLQLPPWENFSHGYAIAICDLVDCIEMTPEFIAQQSQTEILCGDWQVGRYAWKLENIQPITELFAVKGKQGLFSISLDILQSQKQLAELLGDNQENSLSNLLENERDNSLELIVSPSKNSPSNLLGDKENSPSNDFLHSPSKIKLSPSKSSPSNLLGDKENSPSNDFLHSPELIVSPSNSPSNLLGDKEGSSPSNSPELIISPSKKRSRGEGNGYIHWRTITKNNKEYPQAYYHWKEGTKKRSKYIPKKLLGLVIEADSAKRPVIEILELLGVKTSPSKLLGDEEKARRNDVSADISDSAEKLLGDKWIKNGETNISQGSQGSPSNLDNSPSKIELSPSKRRKGDGSGNIHWRTITRGGKDYPQAYYHYEFWKDGDRLVKSSKYISKRLLSLVQRLEVEKAPVKEILKVLGVIE